MLISTCLSQLTVASMTIHKLSLNQCFTKPITQVCIKTNIAKPLAYHQTNSFYMDLDNKPVESHPRNCGELWRINDSPNGGHCSELQECLQVCLKTIVLNVVPNIFDLQDRPWQINLPWICFKETKTRSIILLNITDTPYNSQPKTNQQKPEYGTKEEH